MGQQRLDEDLARQGRADGIAGHADDGRDAGARLAIDHPQHNRMPRPDGDAVDEDAAERIDDVDGVILAAGRRSGVEQDEVMVGGGCGDGRADGFEVIGHDGQAGGDATPRLHLRRQHQRIALDDAPRLRLLGPGGHQFRAGGDDGHARPPVDADGGMARPGQRAQIDRPQPVVGGQHQLGGHHVLAHRPDVLPGRHGGANLDARAAVGQRHRLDVLDHDDRVGPGRQRVAGVDGLGLWSRGEGVKG